MADLGGANPAKLTDVRAPWTGTPRWSRDGKWIAFDSNAEGQYEVYVVSATVGKPRRLTFEPTDDHVPSFSIDGKSLYFSSRRSGQVEIWRLPLTGGDAIQVTRNGGYVAFESFDGRYVYYTQTANGSSPLWRIPAVGGTQEKVLDDVSDRAFVVLEKGIYYVERQARRPWQAPGIMVDLGFLRSDVRSRLRFFDFAHATSRTVADLGERVWLGLAASPDGRTILFTRVDNVSSDLMMVDNFR